MAWIIRVKEEAKEDLKKLDNTIRKRIYSFLETRLSTFQNPRILGGALRGKYSRYWRYRVGDYRIICEIDDRSETVIVVGIGHRREIYH